jgi:alpha-tubulin suppressor-like RCC1 family protein
VRSFCSYCHSLDRKFYGFSNFYFFSIPWPEYSNKNTLKIASLFYLVVTGNVVYQCGRSSNDIYLNNLNKFLSETYATETNDDTKTLTDMVRSFQEEYQLYFLSGGGSNQHNQLLLNRPNNSAFLVGEDAHTRKEIVLSTSLYTDDEAKQLCSPVDVFAGGGHSAILTKNGRLFLWGWNEDLQCGSKSTVSLGNKNDQLLPFIEPLSNISVEKASLGFSHTLVVEKETGRLYAFGNNERGQVTGCQAASVRDISTPPTTPGFLLDEEIDKVEAGMFHSAVITTRGELITFGCNRFGQSNFLKGGGNVLDAPESLTYKYRRWKPPNADRVFDVALGRRHTVVVDSLNRIWSFGENKHGQLGRKTRESKCCTPSIVTMEDTIEKDDTVSVHCGFSHTIIQARSPEGNMNRFYGFGRNDQGKERRRQIC